MYTSPPFGLTSPVIHPPAHVRTAAVSVLGAFNADVLGGTTPEFPGYAGWCRHAPPGRSASDARDADRGADEPDDSGVDGTAAVIRAVDEEFNSVIHSPRVIQCGTFSRRGMLSLMIFDLR